MDDFIIPGKPRKTGGVREVIDVPGSAAPTVKLVDGDVVVVGEVGLRFLVPRVYIILPLELWSRTLSRAVAVAQAELDEAEREGELIELETRRQRSGRRFDA